MCVPSVYGHLSAINYLLLFIYRTEISVKFKNEYKLRVLNL